MAPTAPRLRQHLGYSKFKAPPYRLMFLRYDYFLQNQLLAELRRRGHLVLEIAPEDQSTEAVLRRLLQEAITFRPDALLSLNNMGLDQQGRILTAFTNLSVPVVIWYLDNYHFTGPFFEGGAPDPAIAFIYDRALIPDLEQAGFNHVHYLPLASDPALAEVPDDSRFRVLRDRATYVGGTFSKMVDHFHTDEFERLYREWNPDFTAEKQVSGRVRLAECFGPYEDGFSSPNDFRRFMAYVVFRETRRYRTGRLALLQDQPLNVFGIEDWKNYLDSEIVLGRVDYATQTPSVYRHSAVNLSFGSFQAETALNQRHFDVPLTGGFLLTDWQEALTDHFDVDREAAFFHNDDELKEKVRYYRKNPRARETISMAARERVMKEHLMQHRVDVLLATLEGIFND